jgi:PAS domain S-box-containing protein
MDSKEILYSILRDTEDIFYRTDNNGILIWISPSAVKMLQCNSTEELLGRNFTDEFFTDSTQRRLFLQQLEEKGRITDYQLEMRRSDGSIITVSTDSHCYKDEDGNIAGVEGVCRDITERRDTEEALIQSERKYHALIENSPGVTWRSDRQGNTTFISSNVTDIYGYTPEEIYESGNDLWFKRIHLEDIEAVKSSYDDLFNKGGKFDIEYRIQRRDGQWIWLRDRAVTTYEKDGSACAYGAFSDITDRKQAEETIKESEEKHRRLIDALQEGVWAIDGKENTTFVNNRMAEMLGYAVDEMIGKKVFEFMDERGIELCKYYIEKRKEGMKEQHDFELIRKDGSRIYVTMEASPIYDESGNYMGGVTGVIDVTERKLAEEALVDSEEKFRQITENIEEVFWIVSPDWKRVHYISPAYEKVWGLTSQSLYDRPESWMDSIHEEDRGMVLDYIEQKVSGDLSEIIFPEYRITRSDGGTRWILARGFTIKNEKGKTIRIAGIAEDITERKNAQEVVLNVAKAVSSTTGEKFFESLAEYLAHILEADYAYIAEVVKGKPNHVMTLSLVADGNIVDNIEVDLTGTPCDTVFANNTAAYPSDIQRLFPDAVMMQKMNVEAYFGTLLLGSSGSGIGIMAVMYRKPVRNVDIVKSTLQIFAARASAELERRNVERFLHIQRDMGIALSGTTDLKEALSTLLDAAVVLEGIDCGGVYLMDTASGELDLICSRGLSKDFVSHVRHYDKDSPNVRLILKGKPTYLDYGSLPVSKTIFENKEGLCNIAVIPILHKGKVIACMNVASHSVENIPASTRNVLENISSQVGSVIARLMAESSLMKSEIKYRELYEGLQDGSAAVDMNGRITEYNPAFQKMLGYSNEELYDLLYEDITPEKWHAMEEEIIEEQVFKRGYSDFYEKEYRRKDGTVFPVELRVYLNRDKQGRGVGMWAFVKDITERKHAEESLKRAKNEIDEWNRELERRVKEKTEDLKKSQAQLIQSEKLSAMGRLAAGLAHELNSPLAGLLPLLEKYKGQARAETREFREMAMMCKAAEHMARIIRDFGAFSRMREGVFEKLSLNDIIENTLSFSAGHLKKNSIQIIKEYADDLPEILGDKTELQQVVLNMITNAKDAIHDGGKVILKTGVSKDNKVIMECIDNGRGIEKDSLSKIFDPFFTTKKAGEGVGLGLSLSYGIVKKHKGEILVESEPGKGTRFTVSFPLSS